MNTIAAMSAGATVLILCSIRTLWVVLLTDELPKSDGIPAGVCAAFSLFVTGVVVVKQLVPLIFAPRCPDGKAVHPDDNKIVLGP